MLFVTETKIYFGHDVNVEIRVQLWCQICALAKTNSVSVNNFEWFRTAFARFETGLERRVRVERPDKN